MGKESKKNKKATKDMQSYSDRLAAQADRYNDKSFGERIRSFDDAEDEFSKERLGSTSGYTYGEDVEGEPQGGVVNEVLPGDDEELSLPAGESSYESIETPAEDTNDPDYIHLSKLDRSKSNAYKKQLQNMLGAMSTDAPELVGRDSKYTEQLAALESKLDNASDDIDSKEFYEKMINAVGKMAAGIYGLKTGTNMGGVKTTSTDWDKKFARIADRIKSKQKSIEKQADTDVADRKYVSSEERRATQAKEKAGIDTTKALYGAEVSKENLDGARDIEEKKINLRQEDLNKKAKLAADKAAGGSKKSPAVKDMNPHLKAIASNQSAYAREGATDEEKLAAENNIKNSMIALGIGEAEAEQLVTHDVDEGIIWNTDLGNASKVSRAIDWARSATASGTDVRGYIKYRLAKEAK